MVWEHFSCRHIEFASLSQIMSQLKIISFDDYKMWRELSIITNWNRHIKYCLICATLSLCRASFSQGVPFETPFHNLNSENGLQSSEVYRTQQDSKGNIWFCTDGGVTRYDGYYFKTFTVADGLSDNVIFDLFEDYKGRIWFLSYNSMLCYMENNRILPYKYNTSITKIINDEMVTEKALYIDSSDNLYYSLRGHGLLKIDRNGRIEQLHKEINTAELNLIDNYKMISFRYEPSKVYMIDGHEFNNNVTPAGVSKRTFSMGKDVNRLWFSEINSSAGVRRLILANDRIFNAETNSPIFFDKGILRMGQHSDNQIWIGKLDGLDIGEVGSDGKISIVDTYLEGNSVTDVFWDSQGGCWIATLSNGVFYTNNFSIEHCSFEAGLMNKNVIGITQYKGEIWTSHYQGWQNITDGTKFYSSRASYSKLISSKDKLFISERQFEKIQVEDDKVYTPFICDFYSHNGRIYSVSTRAFRYNDKIKADDTLYNSFADKGKNRQVAFTSIAVDDNDEVYVGSHMGLFRIKNKSSLDYYPNEVASRTYSVMDIVYSKFWGLVVATSNKGVVIFQNGKLIRTIDASGGLTTNNVRCLAVDGDGYLYIGTNSGINVLSPNESSIRHITRNHGLVNQEVNVILPADQFIYVGTKNGLFRISYESLHREEKKTGTIVYLGEVIMDDLRLENPGSELDVPHGAQNLIVKFRIPVFGNWFNKKYQYRYSKSDDWLDLNSPEIMIPRPQGNFEFEVRYMDENNEWSEPFPLISIHTDLPFWKQWYFWIFVLLVFVGVFYVFMRRKQRKIERILRMENAMLSLQQRMQNARMNPHFVFNVLNSIHSCLVFGETELASEYLIKFSGLMRDILKHTGESSIELKNEIKILTKYLELEKMRHNGMFNFHIDATGIPDSTLIPSMMVQPFVENAVLHGVIHNKDREGEIHIKFELKQRKVMRITVKDSGEKTEAVLIKNDNSHAIGITGDRLENYNKMYAENLFGLEITRTGGDLPETIVILSVPILKEMK